MFRDHGESYIRAYKPSLLEIKLIRSIRVCKTPALGGHVYTCRGCQAKRYAYFSCGNSRCPKCQGIKRLQWQDKLAARLLKCPYQHMVFTMPHRLNRIARDNPSSIYNCMMRSAWSSLKFCCEEDKNLGGTPGAVMVLHTFGSDLKYHIHVHCLVSFGGMDKNGKWKWPKRKRMLVGYRQIRKEFRKHFILQLEHISHTLEMREPFEELEKDLLSKSWCVHAEPPTGNTKVIEEYLGRYICRIGLSKNRFHYDEVNKRVHLLYKDYKNKDKSTNQVPKKELSLRPLVAIHRMMQHCLPAYFQKCRYYGLHASASYAKYESQIPQQIKNNNQTVRTLFEILHAMLGLEAFKCHNCDGNQFSQERIKPDRNWIHQWLSIPTLNKGSPEQSTYESNIESTSSGIKFLCPNRSNVNENLRKWFEYNSLCSR